MTERSLPKVLEVDWNSLEIEHDYTILFDVVRKEDAPYIGDLVIIIDLEREQVRPRWGIVWQLQEAFNAPDVIVVKARVLSEETKWSQ